MTHLTTIEIIKYLLQVLILFLFCFLISKEFFLQPALLQMQDLPKQWLQFSFIQYCPLVVQHVKHETIVLNYQTSESPDQVQTTKTLQKSCG